MEKLQNHKNRLSRACVDGAPGAPGSALIRAFDELIAARNATQLANKNSTDTSKTDPSKRKRRRSPDNDDSVANAASSSYSAATSSSSSSPRAGPEHYHDLVATATPTQRDQLKRVLSNIINNADIPDSVLATLTQAITASAPAEHANSSSETLSAGAGAGHASHKRRKFSKK